MNDIQHPLPIGTRVYYEDFDGGNGTIVFNDNTTPEFAEAVKKFDEYMKYVTSPTPIHEMDYIIDFDDFNSVVHTPVQKSGVLRVLDDQ